jgi:hypothetical protein
MEEKAGGGKGLAVSTEDILKGMVWRLCRGVCVGYALWMAYALLRAIRRRAPMTWRLSPGEGHFLLLCGLSPALLKGLYEWLCAHNVLPPRCRSLAAGCVAGLPLLFVTDRHNAQSSISLYVFVRAMELVVRELWASHSLPTPPHLDAAIFILSCSEIMHAWFYHPHTIPAVYAQWITRLAKFKISHFPLSFSSFACLQTFSSFLFEASFTPLTFFSPSIRMDLRLLSLLREMKNGNLRYVCDGNLLSSLHCPP